MKNVVKALIGLLLPTSAMAQSTLFTTPSDDISVKILNQLFGSLVNGGNDAFGAAISTFNGAVLMIGGILATYTILAATLGTAHDGEMLGKKFSSVMLPIRYGLGTALVLPVLPGGYCVMQQIMMWLILQGIGLADSVWGSYMQTPGVAANITLNDNTKTGIRTLAENAFMSQVCVKANATAIENSDSVLTFKSRYDYSMVYDATNKEYDFGDQKGVVSYFTKSNCGQIKLADPIPNSTVANGPKSTNTGYLGKLDDLFAPTDISSINTAQETATAALITTMGALATTVIADQAIDTNKATAYYAKIDTAVDTYLKSIQSAAQAVASSPSASTSTAQNFGWILAGGYFMNTIVTNNKITGAIAAIPSSKFSRSIPLSGAKESFASGLKVLSAGNPVYGSSAVAAGSENGEESSKEYDQVGVSGTLINAITRGLTSIDLYQLKNDARHPVIIINEMGRRLQSYWIGTITLMTAATAASFFPGAAGAIGNFLLVIIGFLGLPIMALAGIAFTASYLIPMLPFMMWLGVIGGWLIAVSIGVLAGPLWAVMHLHPNGDDLTGKGGNGYMLILGLLLRPTLAIFGFIFAITMSSVMGEFINKIYFMVFSFSQGDGNGLGFFIGIIAGTGIYCAIMFSFVKKCFSMMHVIPDEMMKWIGGGGDNLGHYAGKMGEGSIGSAGQVGAFMAGRGLGQGMQNTGRALADIGNKKRGEEKEKAAQSKEAGKDKEAASEKKLDGKKAVSGLSSNIDKSFDSSNVENASEKLTESMGINEDNINTPEGFEKSQALSNAVNMVSSHGPEAQEEFVSRMEEGGPEHAGFSSASEAASFHANEVSSNATLKDANSQFGENAGEFLKAVAPSSTGSGLNLKGANKAMEVLSKASEKLGGELNNVMKEAMETHSGDSAAMSSFVKEATKKAESSEPKVAIDKKDIEPKLLD